MKKNIVFLPCRKGSQRVPNKNTRDFAEIKGGLLAIKLRQLLDAELITEIILSSNDEQVLEIGASFQNSRIKPVNRPDILGTSSTSTDDLIAYVPELVSEGTVIWTHVTSPFIDGKLYDKMLKGYYENQNNYDSLMTVTPLRKFIWNKREPINYNRSIEKWPRTQTIDPLYEVNSGAFIADVSTYRNLKDRIGEKVFLYELSAQESFDIDWQEDFDMAEVFYKQMMTK
jgi:CMP-N-acetylneuraminic acid synthetase